MIFLRKDDSWDRILGHLYLVIFIYAMIISPVLFVGRVSGPRVTRDPGRLARVQLRPAGHTARVRVWRTQHAAGCHLSQVDLHNILLLNDLPSVPVFWIQGLQKRKF